ncbi:hypothetical protein Hamer_G002386, partial [Homarus americanus]
RISQQRRFHLALVISPGATQHRKLNAPGGGTITRSSTGAENDFCPSAGSTPSATALAGYSYSQGWTTPLRYLQYNLTYFSLPITRIRSAGTPLLSRGSGRLELLCYHEDQVGWSYLYHQGIIRP